MFLIKSQSEDGKYLTGHDGQYYSTLAAAQAKVAEYTKEAHDHGCYDEYTIVEVEGNANYADAQFDAGNYKEVV